MLGQPWIFVSRLPVLETIAGGLQEPGRDEHLLERFVRTLLSWLMVRIECMIKNNLMGSKEWFQREGCSHV